MRNGKKVVSDTLEKLNLIAVPNGYNCWKVVIIVLFYIVRHTMHYNNRLAISIMSNLQKAIVALNINMIFGASILFIRRRCHQHKSWHIA